MVERFVSKPIELPASSEEFSRADLIFYDVDHSGDSFEARIFFDAPRVGVEAERDHKRYVDSFYIFGHGGCFGDLGHCDVPTATESFDLRSPHQLLPVLRIVTVTDAVRKLVEAQKESLKVTVVAHTPGKNSNDVLAFSRVRLAFYE